MRERGALPWIVLALLGASGCVSPPTAREEERTYAPTDRILYVGTLYDLRGTGAAPVEAAEGEETSEPPLRRDAREIRIAASEIRSVLADALSTSQQFAAVLNPPAAFTGESPDAMVRTAQQSADYLLVGELNQFHIKSIGFNATGRLSVPLDIILAPAAFATYVTTGGNMYLFSGGIMACWDGEAVLSLSLSLIDTATGHVVRTIRLEERARSRYDGTDAFGNFWDGEDDWIDLGRRLGEVALHNAGVHLAGRLDAVLEELVRTPPAGD